MTQAQTQETLQTTASSRPLLETLTAKARNLRASLPESITNRLPTGQMLLFAGIGFAALVAVLGTLWFWQGDDNWRPLFGGQEQFDTAGVVGVLDGQAIPYRLDPNSGQILVPDHSIASARMQMAVAGITPKLPAGMELLESGSALGRSQFVEKTRYNQGMEGELSKTIMTLNAVRNARVHISIPERSAFMRGQSQATASVVLDLKPGMQLDSRQVNAVIHLVAGSRSELQPENVNVLDQYGTLLTGQPDELNLSNRQITHTRQMERQYIERILNLLEPVVGSGNIRVQVTADVDYSVVEKTSEGFDPESAVVRSESISSEADNSTENTTTAGQPAAVVPGADSQQRQKSQSVRNFELGRTVSNIREATGQIRKLSVAIVINSLPSVSNTEFPPEQLALMNSLAREAVGFDEARGDVMSLHSLPFLQSMIAQSGQSQWENTLQEYTGQSAANVMAMLAIVLVAICLGLLLRVFILRRRPITQIQAPVELSPVDLLTPEGVLVTPNTPQQTLEQARIMATERPELIAHVLKQWIKPE
ncbi:flagellar basal-body MS-ring/collar protein FliF [Endozoicomonas ascidiicola]|uniref:flagellar basal-body MS-ring/collar protein FliF n=1 Tax=Endozoicomonas ascidiicola TaxID=1698521 RepID=UPI000829C8EA|nr:flagellar basal-body MS-ring/collar protein FliF [Endozoicomonas ascidiicola]